MYGNPIDPASIGQDRQYQNPTAAYDAAHGHYADALPTMPTEAKLPTQQMPMAPAPSPFVLHSSATGER
jgi:hypothetical protein